jgi:hypothetical protein
MPFDCDCASLAVGCKQWVPAQDINFGINLPTLSRFLDAHTLDYVVSATASKPMRLVDIAAPAQKSTVQVQCN